MKLIERPKPPLRESSSAIARQRFERLEGWPLFHSGWMRALFIHYEVDRDVLQSQIPFELDLHEGRAIVSLVAFTMQGLRLPIAGRLGA